MYWNGTTSFGALSAGANNLRVHCDDADIYHGLQHGGGELVLHLRPQETDTGAEAAALFRHVPTSDNAAELWAFQSTTTAARLAAGTAFASVTLKTAIASTAAAYFVRGESFAARFYTAYDTTINRLHVWDGSAHRT